MISTDCDEFREYAAHLRDFAAKTGNPEPDDETIAALWPAYVRSAVDHAASQVAALADAPDRAREALEQQRETNRAALEARRGAVEEAARQFADACAEHQRWTRLAAPAEGEPVSVSAGTAQAGA